MGAVRWPLTAALVAGAAPMLLALIVSAIWPGAWCYRLCPLGCVQDMLHWPRRVIARRRSAPAARGSAAGGAVFASRRTALFSLTALVAGGAGSFAGRRAVGTDAAVLRPPGAAEEGQFQALCTRCGNCVRACPAGILRMDLGSSGAAGLLTPVLRIGPGYCREDCHECTKVCPSGAIARLTLAEKSRHVIGLAAIDKRRCCPWAGLRECDTCVSICPTEAVDNFMINPPLPVVIENKCNGCGKCEMVCPVQGGTAIAVLPAAEKGRR
jgi:ferredoxin